jgi:hypothetical protein
MILLWYSLSVLFLKYTPWTGLSDLLTFFDPRKPFRFLAHLSPLHHKNEQTFKGTVA